MTNRFYLNRCGTIPQSLQDRRKWRSQVQSDVNRFVEAHYGIEDFTSLVHSLLPQDAQQAVSEGKSVGVLARQVPGICAEDVGMFILCRKLGLFPVALSFTRDTFVNVSHDKRHRVHIPWVEWSRKGNQVVQYEDVSIEGFTKLDRRRLDLIAVKNSELMPRGGTLPEYHQNVRHQVFNGSYPVNDVSTFHGELLARTTLRKPAEVYRTENGKEVLVAGGYTADEARSLTVRPRSDWYYPLYLSMFVDGSLVLLDTYENPDGGVPEAKALFEKTMNSLTSAYHWTPLVIQTAPLCLDMMFCNRSLFQTAGAAEELCEKAKLWHITTYDASRHFADLAVTFGKK